MELPFSVEAFLNLFGEYNQTLQPFQFLAYALGIAVLITAFKHVHLSGKIVSSILALFWLWVGAVYHIAFFTAINQAAYVFGGVFILHGLLLLYAGVLRTKLTFAFNPDVYGYTGLVLVLYAMVVYPVLNAVFGHVYPRMPVFGVVPCPVTIFTFGVYLWAQGRLPVYLLIIPLLWSLIGVSAAVQLTIIEDYGMVVAGVLGSVLTVMKNRKQTLKIT